MCLILHGFLSYTFFCCNYMPKLPLMCGFVIDLHQFCIKNAVFLKTFFENSCVNGIFALPLHPLSRNNETQESSKKEFFEKIT